LIFVSLRQGLRPRSSERSCRLSRQYHYHWTRIGYCLWLWTLLSLTLYQNLQPPSISPIVQCHNSSQNCLQRSLNTLLLSPKCAA
jgi:hypothetical protein